LDVEVEIDPESNKSCEGLYLSSGIFCTQCEAESFRKITYFLDRPDVMTSYTVEIEADEAKYPVLLSNGDCLEKKTLGNGRHYAKWNDPHKKPSYLFALVAGDMGVVSDTYKTTSGRQVKLEVFAPHGKQERCLHAMNSLKQSMKWDEDTYSLEYDLNQYMVVSIDDFNMGAMENKGLNIFNSKLVLADVKTATDDDFHQIQSVIGHEYFHNWSGNRVTCRNWFELSLKEGLTVFRDQEFSGDMTSRSVQRIHDVDSLRTRQFSEDSGPNAHAVRPESCLAVDNFYTATIYEKGAEVIRMMQTIVGREGFKKGLALYFKRHDGQAVTIENFAAAISDANQIDFTQFKLWYSQAGTPVVHVEESYDVDSKQFKVKLTQSCELTLTEKENPSFAKKPFYIPLRFGLILSTGEVVKTPMDLLTLKDVMQEWIFENISEKPILSINREFSAPVKLVQTINGQDLLSLIKFDSDAFNRREACMKMLLEETRRLISCYKNKTSMKTNPDVIEALGYVLNDSKIDAQMKALMLSLPSNLVIAQEEDILAPEAFVQAKKTIVTDFVNQFKNDLVKLYKQHHPLDNIGDRTLKNKILDFLITHDDKDSLKLCEQQYQTALNMTDKIHALNNLCNSQSAFKNQAIESFYTEWSHDSVVFNKWLTVLASAIYNQDTFKVIEQASQKPAFDKNNPNNLYALHRVFSNNFLHFHQASGATYKWFADEIIRVDQFNPQVAARLASGFSLTKKLPADLSAKSKTEIQRILNAKVSKNTQEILEKCI
jgi:aminopeptidase N